MRQCYSMLTHKQCEREACTFPCMSSRSVRVTPKPPSPKSCSQFIVMWEWHAGRRMNKANSLCHTVKRRPALVLCLSEVLQCCSEGEKNNRHKNKLLIILKDLLFQPTEEMCESSHEHMHSCLHTHHCLHPICKSCAQTDIDRNSVSLFTKHFEPLLKLIAVF